jgi:hypothetical protein
MVWKHIYSEDFEKQIYSLSKIVLSQEGETWLVKIKDQPRIVEVLLQKHIGCVGSDIATIILDGFGALIAQIMIGSHDHNREALRQEVYVGEAHSPPITRRGSRLKRHNKSGSQPPLEPRSTLEQPISWNDEPSLESIEVSSKSSNFNQFEVQPITSWIGNHQLKDQTIPQSTLNGVTETHENYPDRLLAIPSTNGGPPRIIVSLTTHENLLKQAQPLKHSSSESQKGSQPAPSIILVA